MLDNVTPVALRPVTQQNRYSPISGYSIRDLTYFKLISVPGSSGHINLYQLHVGYWNYWNNFLYHFLPKSYICVVDTE